MTNPFTSRFALGDKVIAGKNSRFPVDSEGSRQWHDFANGESTVVAVTFRAGKTSYTVATLAGKERVFESCDVEPAQACGIAGVADDCTTGFDRDLNMHTVGLPQG